MDYMDENNQPIVNNIINKITYHMLDINDKGAFFLYKWISFSDAKKNILQTFLLFLSTAEGSFGVKAFSRLLANWFGVFENYCAFFIRFALLVLVLRNLKPI